MNNPLLADWGVNPLGLPPFDAVGPAHFAPAFDVAMRQHRADIDAIAHNPEPPSFANTIAAFDRAGALYAHIEAVFWNLVASASTPALQAVQRALAAPLAAHENAIRLHAALFERIAALHTRIDALGLEPEQRRLLERTQLDFVRAGAELQGEARQRRAQIAERLAELNTRFAQNVLADESGWTLELRGEAELAGLPASLRAAARQAAVERGLHGSHVVTLARSLVEPFLTFSERRDLRERAWRAWSSRGESGGETDNREVVREVLALRRELASLHGHDNYADYKLEDTMARTQHAVRGLLERVWTPALAAVARERDAIASAMAAAGASHRLEPWDWRFYAERVRRTRFDVDDAEVKPYFALDAMVRAAFDCAHALFGIRFAERPDVRVYHPDVKVYEVRNAADDTLRGVFLHDNFARLGKRSGAWMSSYRVQHRNGEAVLPIVVNNNNFAKAADGQPTLLTHDDARTLFHELGHGLHGLLSDVTYRQLSGTSVLRDFVELPSQLFEHWLDEPQVLARHARHHASGEPIAPALVERLQRARRFGQGFDTVSYAASAWVDLALHARADEVDDIAAFERALLERLGTPAEVGMRHRLVHFNHLFSGDAYAAGYYVYLWAEVLDADAFEAFVEAGDPFDSATAQRLKQHIYSAGGSREPGAAYRAFRGRDAAIEPMLRGRGLL